MSSSASVTPLIADATTTTPDGRIATIWAACLMAPASAKPAPPNLCTTADVAERAMERATEGKEKRADSRRKRPRDLDNRKLIGLQ